MLQPLILPDGTVIPEAELQWEFLLAAGPGGQKVNKTSTAVRLRWDLTTSPTVPEVLRTLLLENLQERLLDGKIAVTAREERSQMANRQLAIRKLTALLFQAGERPIPRRATKPTRNSVIRRLNGKKRRSAVKAARRCTGWGDGLEE